MLLVLYVFATRVDRSENWQKLARIRRIPQELVKRNTYKNQRKTYASLRKTYQNLRSTYKQPKEHKRKHKESLHESKEDLHKLKENQQKPVENLQEPKGSYKIRKESLQKLKPWANTATQLCITQFVACLAQAIAKRTALLDRGFYEWILIVGWKSIRAIF